MIARLPGYMTARQALAAGFTHHGKYMGVPCWLGNIDIADGDLKVATKWAPLEHIMPLLHWIEGTLQGLMYPDDEPLFRFKMGARIEPFTPSVKVE